MLHGLTHAFPTLRPSDLDQQRDSGTLECPVCGTGAVSKALMAPSIAKGREPATATQAPAPEVQAAAEMQAMHPAVRQVAELTRQLRALRSVVQGNRDYVGDCFPAGARRIHYGAVAPPGPSGAPTPA